MIKRPGYILQIYFAVSGFLFLGVCLHFGTDNVFLSQFIPKSEKKQSTIGRIRSTEGDTRVRPAGELLWIPGKPHDPIRDYDSIFIGSNGSMKIDIEPGTTLQVNKDSLFKVSRKDHLTTIQVVQGELHASGDKQESLRIKAQGKSKTVNLTEVEKKISYGEFNESNLPSILTVPSSEDLKTALEDDDPDFQPSNHSNMNASLASNSSPFPASEPLAPTSDSKRFTDESNKGILWLMGAAYTIFSIIALSEFIRPRKT